MKIYELLPDIYFSLPSGGKKGTKKQLCCSTEMYGCMRKLYKSNSGFEVK